MAVEYATWDPANAHASLTFSNGNRTIATPAVNGSYNAKSTLGKTAGKHYLEVTVNLAPASFGVCPVAYPHNRHIGELSNYSDFGCYFYYGGTDCHLYNKGAYTGYYITGLSYQQTVFGIAADLDNRLIFYRGPAGWGSRGGVGDPETGANPAATLDSGQTYYIGGHGQTWNSVPLLISINAGQDAFVYPVPSGYNAGWYDGYAPQTALADAKLQLAAWHQGLADLPAWLKVAYLTGLDDLPLDLRTLGRGLYDLPAPLRAAALGLGPDFAARLAAAAGYRQDMALGLATASPEVLHALAMRLSASDGTRLNDMALRLAAIKMAPAYQAVVAQRLQAVSWEVS